MLQKRIGVGIKGGQLRSNSMHVLYVNFEENVWCGKNWRLGALPIHTVPASVSAVVLFINIRGIVIIASRIYSYVNWWPMILSILYLIGINLHFNELSNRGSSQERNSGKLVFNKYNWWNYNVQGLLWLNHG